MAKAERRMAEGLKGRIKRVFLKLMGRKEKEEVAVVTKVTRKGHGGGSPRSRI
jgi:hypothetical protein